MSINNNLFKLIKSNQKEEFIKIINNNDIDCNIRDNNNNYLIQYAIIFNMPNIISLLISKGSKLDMIDIDGRTLLFIPIKYGYNDAIKVLLEKNQENIGISLLEYSDVKGLFPIHYAILFKNEEAIDLLIQYMNNIDIPDINGNTPLHYAIKIKNNNIFKKILSKQPDINFQTNQGETALHIACNFTQIDMIEELLKIKNINVNIQDYENQITPLMYSIILDNNKLFSLLLDKSNIEIQDMNGNNAIHYAINENNTNMINLLLNRYNKILSTNLAGKTPLHLLLENVKSNNIDIFKIDIESFIKKSNLNTQDYDGNSCFMNLIKNKLWKRYINILENKKLNSFIKNHRNETAFNMIDPNDKDLLLNLLTKSYLNIIRSSLKIDWKTNIDNQCKNILSYKRYLNIKSELNIDIDETKIKKYDKDICPYIIKQNIEKNKISFPLKLKNYCIDLDFEYGSNFVTYTGVTLDILFGLIYLLKNYSNIISTTLTINFRNNEKLKNFYNKNEDRKIEDDEFLNIEIIWNNQNIFYPDILDEVISNFKSKIEKRFLIIPIGIELSQDSHANILIYDKDVNEIERFEPNGSNFPFKFNYNPNLLDKLLKDKFEVYFKKVKYYTPNDYLPKISFQILESYDYNKTKKIGDPGGFCAAWCTWYAYMRIKYDKLDRKKLTLKLIRKIKEENISFKDLIRNFANKIVLIRDNSLNEFDLDINKWLNGNYEKVKLDKLIISIQNMIKELL